MRGDAFTRHDLHRVLPTPFRHALFLPCRRCYAMPLRCCLLFFSAVLRYAAASAATFAALFRHVASDADIMPYACLLRY